MHVTNSDEFKQRDAAGMLPVRRYHVDQSKTRKTLGIYPVHILRTLLDYSESVANINRMSKSEKDWILDKISALVAQTNYHTTLQAFLCRACEKTNVVNGSLKFKLGSTLLRKCSQEGWLYSSSAGIHLSLGKSGLAIALVLVRCVLGSCFQKEKVRHEV